MIKSSILVLAGGRGIRMGEGVVKVLRPLAFLPLLRHTFLLADSIGYDKKVCVLNSEVSTDGFDEDWQIVIQDLPLGTGDAFLRSVHCFDDCDGIVTIVYGDTPLLKKSTLLKLQELCIQGACCAVTAFIDDGVQDYGRLVFDQNKTFLGVIEAKDRDGRIVRDYSSKILGEGSPSHWNNGGVIALNWGLLQRSGVLNLLKPHGGGECYLTDLLYFVHCAGLKNAYLEVSVEELMGVNVPEDLEYVEKVWQKRKRVELMGKGVTFYHGESVFLAWDVQCQAGCVIEPHVVLGPGVILEEGVVVRSFSYLQGTRVKKNSVVGPFFRGREGTVIGEDNRVGSFVELKNTVTGRNTKMSHFAYYGDSVLGDSVNVGAMSVTCNYDGVNKWGTQIETGAFVGGHTAFVAPCCVGEGAYIGAGSVVRSNVPSGSLYVQDTVSKVKPMRAKSWIVGKKLVKMGIGVMSSVIRAIVGKVS